MDKLLKEVDENGYGIKSVFTSKCHYNYKVIHECIHCFLITKTGGFILQKRVKDITKSSNEWDIGINEHVHYKETPENAIKRSLQKTLGFYSCRSPKLIRGYILETDVEIPHPVK